LASSSVYGLVFIGLGVLGMELWYESGSGLKVLNQFKEITFCSVSHVSSTDNFLYMLFLFFFWLDKKEAQYELIYIT
jgi:hypothetical protein